MTYGIITPARNEASYIKYTLDSVTSQTILPRQWVIVDDGSTDKTAEIVINYAHKYPWIKLVHHNTPNISRAGGVKVVKAFNYGFEALEISDYSFIVKLDADLSLPTNYFEEVAKAYQADYKVGLCGGYISELSNGVWQKEKVASYHLRGAIKSYRKGCFEEIGGVPMSLNWDFIDGMKAMFLGWEIKILPLEVKHHRKTSTLINRGLKNAFFAGQQYYKSGYDVPLAILRSVTYGYRTKPLVLSSLAFCLGFIFDRITRPQKEVSPELGAFIREFQYNRIKTRFVKKEKI